MVPMIISESEVDFAHEMAAMARDKLSARDPKVLPSFLKIGIDELSVSPVYTLSLRDLISRIDTRELDLDSYLY